MKFSRHKLLYPLSLSRPARGAWVEMLTAVYLNALY